MTVEITIAGSDMDTQVSTVNNRTATAARSTFNVGTQVSSRHTHQPLTRFQATIMQKRRPSLPKKSPTVLV